jgi:hypothetical protein
MVSVLRSVARRRLLETENPSACAAMNWNVCKSTIALYCPYLSVIKRECVTYVLINPIIRTRTRHFCHVYHPTHDNMYFLTTYIMVKSCKHHAQPPSWRTTPCWLSFMIQYFSLLINDFTVKPPFKVTLGRNGCR